MVGRPRLYDDRLRDRLASCAAGLLSTGGARALSVRKVASAAGTSTAAVYTLFGGRQGLIETLYTNAFARLGDEQRAVVVSDDPLTDIISLGLAYRRTAIDDPHGYRVMFGDEIRPSDVGREAAEEAGRTFEPLVAAVRRAVASGSLPPEPSAAAIATALWGNAHGLVSLELGRFLPPLAEDPAVVFEAAIRAALDGWTSKTVSYRHREWDGGGSTA